ncbi:cytochrome c biogenesis CcdA family protein [Candidatus Latescibacterota bacterium]
MIISFFTWLDSVLNSSPVIALIGSFIWGVLSIILSPCHLASIPLIVGFIDQQGKMTTKRAFILAVLFSLGILVTIALIGLVTGMLGRILGDIGKLGNYFVAVIFFIVGLYLLDVLSLPFLEQAGQPSFRKKGMLAVFILGLIFGIALGPCTFAYMAPMLGIVFSVAATQFYFAIMLIVMYALGHCSVIIIAGTFTGLVQRYLNWNERSKGAVILKRICGVLVIFGGVYMIYTVL